MSLSGRIGIGNIAGVATAIAFGGPGAVFWMWVMGFLGASTSYIESTLAQIYKVKDAEGRYRGGPAYYIEKAMGLKRSEEHTSELQSLMRISYAVFCLKKKNKHLKNT